MKISKFFLFSFLSAVAAPALAVDSRQCNLRTGQDQLALAKDFVTSVQKNDPQGDALAPVLYSLFYGHVTEVDDALAKGLNPNLEVDAGVGFRTPLLDLAITACQPSIAVLLIKQGANVNGNGSAVPIVDAADFGIDRVVGVLINHHANIEQENSSGDTALRNAVAQGHYSTVQILLQNGANPNHTTHGDHSVLGTRAVDPNDVKIAALLKSYGAVPGPTD